MGTEIEEYNHKYSWGVSFDIEDNPHICGVIEDYENLPKMLNECCKQYIEKKGRGIEREKIRPQIKDILIDLHTMLSNYGDNIIAHIEIGEPLRYELLGLDIERCNKIFRECQSIHIDKNIIHYGIALFGAMLKAFYLYLDTKFLPNDFRNTCKQMGINDYYSLAETVADMWEDSPPRIDVRVTIGIMGLAREMNKEGLPVFICQNPVIF